MLRVYCIWEDGGMVLIFVWELAAAGPAQSGLWGAV